MNKDDYCPICEHDFCICNYEKKHEDEVKPERINNSTFEQYEPSTFVCGKCGAEKLLYPKSFYCSNCGIKIKWEDE
jgi:hypothetical protein